MGIEKHDRCIHLYSRSGLRARASYEGLEMTRARLGILIVLAWLIVALVLMARAKGWW